MSRRLVRTLPAALAPVVLLWVAASQGVFPSPAVVVVTVTVVAALVVAELRRGLLVSPAAAWLAALVAWAVLATWVRPVDHGAAAGFVATGVVAVALAMLAARPRPAAWGRLGIVSGGCLAAGWLIVDRLVAEGRPAGPFENPNVAATVVAIALALAPALPCRVAPRLGVAAFLVAGIVASGSRAAMLAAVVIGLVWVTAARRALRVAVAGVAAIAALAFTLRVALDRDPLRFERTRIWLVALRTATAELPLGCGPAGYSDAAARFNFPREGEVARYYRLPTLAESDALEVAASLGLPGLLLASGLVVTLVRGALGRPQALAAVLAVAVTSAMHTQLPLPAVAWTAALAVMGTTRRTRLTTVKASTGVAAAAAIAVASASAYALGAAPGRPETAARLAAGGEALLERGAPQQLALADAEADASRACTLRPRWAGAWSLLGSLRLERALTVRDAQLAAAAADAFAVARRTVPVDVWAAVGEGRARRALGDAAGAASALEAAVRLEPNCVPAWVELTLLRLDAGEIAAARAALDRIDAALELAHGRVPVSDYERAMVRVDRQTLYRLRLRCGVMR